MVYGDTLTTYLDPDIRSLLQEEVVQRIRDLHSRRKVGSTRTQTVDPPLNPETPKPLN